MSKVIQKVVRRAAWISFGLQVLGMAAFAPSARALTFSEIMYAPLDPQLEFIEIYNEDAEARELTNYCFTNGIRFCFTERTFIRGKSFLVVALDIDRMLREYSWLENTDPLFPNVVGNYEGFLDNGGERVELANPGGAVEISVRYNNRGSWPSAADETGHSLVMVKPEFDDPDRSGSWTFSPLIGGSPGLANFGEQRFEDKTLLKSGDAWRYFKGTSEPSDPREAWREPGFDHTSWPEGPTPIGYGDAIYTGVVLDDMKDTYISVFMRRAFELQDLDGLDALILKTCFDDGFVAYLNGQEVARRNIREDTFDARAVGSGECRDLNIEFDITAFKDLLVVGTNVLAVQFHNITISSNDAGFDCELVKRRFFVVGAAPKVDVDLNELFSNTGGERWLEIYNDAGRDVDVSGWFLSDDSRNLRKFQIPPGTIIKKREFLVLTEAQVSAADPKVFFSLPVNSPDDSLFLVLSRPLPLPEAPPEANQVVDARHFRIPAAAGVSNARYPDGSSDWVLARNPTRGAANRFDAQRSVVINEIMYHPYYPAINFPTDSQFAKPEEQGEYIELFNRGTEPVSLKGWALTSGVEYRFADDASIPAGGFLVIARDPDWIASHYGLPADVVLGPWYNERVDALGQVVRDSAVLADSGERITLTDDLGNPVNSVEYADGGDWPRWADGRGSSLELIDPFQDNSQSMAWDASDDSSKSEWKHYSYRATYQESGEFALWVQLLTEGIVHIDNLRVYDPNNPGVPNNLANGTFDVDTRGWLIDGTHINSGRITFDKKDGDGCLRLVAAGRGNDRLDRLKSPLSGLQINRQYTVEFDARWIAGDGVVHMQGVWNTMAGAIHVEVPQKLGSPGQPNSVYLRMPSKNQGPLITRVRHSPKLPGPGQETTISARVADPDGVKEVQLAYSLNLAGGAKTVLPMVDDGTGADEEAGDGIYTAAIEGQTVNTRVVFSITAADNPGNIGRFPVDSRLRTAPFFLDPAGTPDNEIRYAVYQHTEFSPGGLPEYRMVLTQEDYSYLTTRRVMNNELLNSTLIWNDSEVWYDARIRYGNSPWTRAGGSNITGTSYVVKLPREKQIGGIKKFKFDHRGSEINERAVFHLFRANNVPGRVEAPCPYLRSTYIQAFLNNTRFGAAFERVEMVGKPWLDRWFPGDSEGILYKLDDKFLVDGNGKRAANRDAFIRYPVDGSNSGGGENEENYRWYFFHRTRDKYDDFSELIDLAKFFTQKGGAAYEAEIFDRVNVESVIRTVAVEFNVDDWDTWGSTRGKNCYFYRPRIDGRWVLIGWDKDLTFGNPGGLPLVPGMFQEASKLLNSGPGRKVYHTILKDMLDSFYNANYLNEFYSQQAIDKDGQRILGMPSSAAGPAGFLTTRANTMRSVTNVNSPFDVTSAPNGVQVVNKAEVILEGRSPLETWSILIIPEGKDEAVFNVRDILWTQTTRWRLPPIAVEPGSTSFTLVALNNLSDPIGSSDITVVYPVDWKEPTVTKIEPSSGSSNGNTQVTITGTDFHGGVRVFFGQGEAQVTAVGEAEGFLVAVTPPGPEGPAAVKVQNLDGKSVVLPDAFTFTRPEGLFNRGDIDGSGVINITDPLVLLEHLFLGGSIECEKAGDVDDDGALSVTDAIVHLEYQFLGGPAPPPPFDQNGSACGVDPTADGLSCAKGCQ